MASLLNHWIRKDVNLPEKNQRTVTFFQGPEANLRGTPRLGISGVQTNHSSSTHIPLLI